ncbi:MAG: hypothetical protein KBB32_01510 [Spirochaetia bacterium]|nr:hypothetical protein [Spirochaetia bacterium]
MLTLEIVKSALLAKKVTISDHAVRRKYERGIPLDSVLEVLPYRYGFTKAIPDKYDPKVTRLLVNVDFRRATYTLVFGDEYNEVTLITEYVDHRHRSFEDDHYSLGDVIRKAG